MLPLFKFTFLDKACFVFKTLVLGHEVTPEQ